MTRLSPQMSKPINKRSRQLQALSTANADLRSRIEELDFRLERSSQIIWQYSHFILETENRNRRKHK